MIGPAIPCRAVPHGLGVTQLGSSRALLVSQNAPGSLPLRRERALCLSRETVINGCSVRSVMDQQCSFPRFPTPAASLEGWQPARRSIVLLSQPSPRKLTSIHPQRFQSCGIMDSQLCPRCRFWSTCQRNAPTSRQRTNDQDLFLTRVSVGWTALAHSQGALVGWLSLTLSTNL